MTHPGEDEASPRARQGVLLDNLRSTHDSCRTATAGGSIALDAMVILAGSALVFWLSVQLDWFERILAWTREHEEWEIDELAAIAIVLPFAFAAFAFRRWRELRREIDARGNAEAALLNMAFHDALTGLPNRALLLERLGDAMERAPGVPSAAVLFLDLDDFKIVNDSLGHPAGDEMLVEVAARLRTCIRPTDTVARMEGDEFTILVVRPRDIAAVVAVAERVVRCLDAPFRLQRREVFSHVSVGIAVAESSNELPVRLLRKADAALYEAKKRGKARHVTFEPSMDAPLARRLHNEYDLRRAIDHGELRLHYQPVIGLQGGRIQGIEALVRWQHPERGLVSPGEFIPLAEETGLIVPLGRWVLEHACRQVKAWSTRHPGLAELIIGVNVSGRQLQDPHLIETVRGALEKAELEPGLLEIEITESYAVRDEASTATLHELRRLGARLALDDFGTGYSSLAALKTLPVDTLKIDRSFVSGLDDDRSPDLAIAAAVVAFAKALDLHVNAEGIETAEQARALRALGCDTGQGYYLAPPLDSTAAEALLVANLAQTGAEPARTEPRGTAIPIQTCLS